MGDLEGDQGRSRPSLGGLAGRVAFVTIAGDDIGRAVALALAEAGVHVAVHVTDDEAAGDAVAKAARDFGVEATTVVGDLARPEACAAMVGAARERLGPIDVLVHCVYERPHSTVAASSIEEWQHVLAMNCSSFFYLAQQVLPLMAERGFGRLIGMPIGARDISRPAHAATAAARAALTAVVTTIAVEEGRAGITANLVSPAITTNSKPAMLTTESLEWLLAIPRPAELEEVAFACLYLASDEGAYLTGQTLYLDGGYQA
jgi:NAD(P)-dependent dehydrogenase (short-subunit alcohol dehydrogenase family)